MTELEKSSEIDSFLEDIIDNLEFLESCFKSIVLASRIG